MIQRRWRKDEIDYLIDNYNILSLNEIAEKLNRTVASIAHAIHRFGLKNKKQINDNKEENEWNENEINFLIENYKLATDSYLSDYLNKDKKSIKNMMKKLNLKQKDRNVQRIFFHPKSIEFIKNNYLNYNDEELTKIINDRFEPSKHKRNIGSVVQFRKNVLNLIRPHHIIRNTNERNWTEQEEQYLIDNCYFLTFEEISKHLNRTKKAIEMRMTKLKLNKITNIGTKFTQEKNQYLRDNFDKLPINQICQELQIPVFRIIAQAQYLGLIQDIHYLTDIEIFIKKKLIEFEINFTEQTKIKFDKRSWYKVDFLLENNLILEIQGDYYHCNPELFPNGPQDHIQAEIIERDKNKLEKLISLGYKVKYIWENDIKNKQQEVIRYLAALSSDRH